jgi:WD40 repeat protein
VRGLAFSRNGKLLASGDAQATVRIWDVESGKKVQEIDNQSLAENLSLAFAVGDKTLLCAGAWNDSGFRIPKDGVIKINGKEVKLKGGFTMVIQGVKMTPKEGNYLLEWDVKTGKQVRRFGGLRDKIRSLAYSPDGRLVAAASRDGRIILWDARTGKDRLHIMAHPANTDAPFISSPHLVFSPDGQTLASASTDGTIRFWDVTTAKETGRFQVRGSTFSSLIFAPDGKTVISGSADTGVLVWDVKVAGNPSPQEKSVVFPIR